MNTDIRAAAGLLARFSDEMTAVVDDAMGTDFADNGEIRVLVAVLRPKPPSTAELARLGRLNRRAVTRLISKLVASGLVTADRSGEDGRVVLVHCTARGRRRGSLMRDDFDQLCRESRSLAADVVSLLSDGDDGPVSPQQADALLLLDELARTGLDILVAAALRADAVRLPPRHRVALIGLATQDELRPTQLMTALGLTSGGVTYLVDQLAASGFVQRRYGDVDSDRRAVTITITSLGLEAVASVYQGIAATRRPLCAVFRQVRDRARLGLDESALSG